MRAHLAAKEVGLKLIVGARLDLQDAPSLLCLPRDRQAYGRLSRLLSLGQMRAKKGACTLYLDDVAQHAEGQIFIALPPDDWDWRASAGAANAPRTAAIIPFVRRSEREAQEFPSPVMAEPCFAWTRGRDRVGGVHRARGLSTTPSPTLPHQGGGRRKRAPHLAREF